MEISICPLDNRYKTKISQVAEQFSAQNLTWWRLKVMIRWLNFILSLRNISTVDRLEDFVEDDPNFHQKIEELEFQVTHHDINAATEYLKNKCIQMDRTDVIPFIHFGLTSNDVNSVAYCMMIESGVQRIYNKMAALSFQISKFGDSNPYSMLAHTHGQPATPITFKYAMNVFFERLRKKDPPKLRCKFGGATGGLNALYLIDPDMDWRQLLNQFIKSEFDLECNQFTTQIDHYDEHADVFNWLKQICVILINFSRDIWMYISKGYIIQKPVKEEVGSSTMPHKINPIQMENAEGNLMMAISLLETLSRELPISRMQRDLHDSTMLRNVGMAFGYAYLAMISISEGLNRYSISEDKMLQDLRSHWEVLAEAVQTMLRHEGHANAYDLVKAETRTGAGMDSDAYQAMVNRLPLSEEGRKKLLKLTPENYLPGY